jgi:hypothetical protein
LPVRKAMERIQLDLFDAADEKLVSAWLEWSVQQEQMNDTEKWQSPAKRLKSSVDALRRCIAS